MVRNWGLGVSSDWIRKIFVVRGQTNPVRKAQTGNLLFKKPSGIATSILCGTSMFLCAAPTPFEPLEPIEPAEPLSQAIKRQNAPVVISLISYNNNNLLRR